MLRETCQYILRLDPVVEDTHFGLPSVVGRAREVWLVLIVTCFSNVVRIEMVIEGTEMVIGMMLGVGTSLVVVATLVRGLGDCVSEGVGVDVGAPRSATATRSSSR